MSNNPVILSKQLARIKAAFAKDNRNPVVVQSELRLESALSATATQFNFNMSKTTSGFNTEVKLDLNDMFFVTEINVQVAAPSSATASDFRLFNYGNRAVFSAANTFASIEGLYANGVLNVSKDQVLYLQQWALRKHYHVPIWQDSLTTGFTTTGSTAPNGTDAYDGACDGFYPVVPGINFSGKDNVNISISVPTNLTAVVANSRIVMTLRGFKAFNASL